MSATGRFVWYDLITRDPAGAKSFYGATAGWQARDWGDPEVGYAQWIARGAPVGGVVGLAPEMERAGFGTGWMGHVAVDDVDATAGRAVELGGRVVTPPTDIPTIGRYAVIADPQGAIVALVALDVEPQLPASPMDAAIAWAELHTHDADAAWSFYSALFGWQVATRMDMGEGWIYPIFRHQGDPEDLWAGGIFDATRRGAPVRPHWKFYVAVEGMDAALERIRAAGGIVAHGPDEVPGGGRAAEVADPQGGAFGVFAMS